MEVIRGVEAMRQRAEHLRQSGERIVLVPTMGGLHRGHLALATAAQSHGSHVIVSIFVNPSQFSPGEDFEAYPRDLERDCDMLRGTGAVDTVFAPPVEELYPAGAAAQNIWVSGGRLAEHLCGPHRPGHFTGVLTVVTKLFGCCRPHAALFGLKDAQQFFMLRRLSEDLALGVNILGHPTIREPDGLALSSRNSYLSPYERADSVVVSQSVQAAQRAIEAGETRADLVIRIMVMVVHKANSARLEYAEVVRTRDLQPVEHLTPGEEVLAAVAVYFGKARLIDNAIVQVPSSS